MKKKLVALSLAIVLALTGCHTVRGFGSDVVGGTDAGVRWLESYSNDYNSAYGQPRMIN